MPLKTKEDLNQLLNWYIKDIQVRVKDLPGSHDSEAVTRAGIQLLTLLNTMVADDMLTSVGLAINKDTLKEAMPRLIGYVDQLTKYEINDVQSYALIIRACSLLTQILHNPALLESMISPLALPAMTKKLTGARDKLLDNIDDFTAKHSMLVPYVAEDFNENLDVKPDGILFYTLGMFDKVALTEIPLDAHLMDASTIASDPASLASDRSASAGAGVRVALEKSTFDEKIKAIENRIGKFNDHTISIFKGGDVVDGLRLPGTLAKIYTELHSKKTAQEKINAIDVILMTSLHSKSASGVPTLYQDLSAIAGAPNAPMIPAANVYSAAAAFMRATATSTGPSPKPGE
ncbi:MAG: hypothetical protein Q7V63_09535 [Gammaproteobacteria bacterium]|nr:hypothetical protein [Gammaproteobacteria bacterium]